MEKIQLKSFVFLGIQSKLYWFRLIYNTFFEFKLKTLMNWVCTIFEWHKSWINIKFKTRKPAETHFTETQHVDAWLDLFLLKDVLMTLKMCTTWTIWPCKLHHLALIIVLINYVLTEQLFYFWLFPSSSSSKTSSSLSSSSLLQQIRKQTLDM